MIINATNIGKKISGLGRYSLYLAKYFVHQADYQVYINANAKDHFTQDEQQKLHIVSAAISPDHGLLGHLRRLIWTQSLKGAIFNPSQLEFSCFNRNQIITIHDLIPLHFRQNSQIQWFYFKFILPQVLKRVKKIITVSHHTKQQLIQYYGLDADKIVVIHNGIAVNSQEPTLNKQDYCLSVGRDTATKNVKRLCQAFIQAKKQHQISAKLILVGLKQAPIAHPDIQCISYASDQQLQKLYQQAKIFIFPSLYEGFGYPPLEAMANGTPVICANTSSLPEICNQAALYIDPYNVEQLTDKIQHLLKDKKQQQQLIQAGFNNILKFSLTASIEKHLAVFST